MVSVTSIPDYEEALDGLARTIRKHRNDWPPHETARQLLEHDHPGHMALVGVRYDAGQAVLYQEAEEYVIGIEFGADGLGEGGPILAEFDFGTSVYSWVRQMRYYWGWIHPRFR